MNGGPAPVAIVGVAAAAALGDTLDATWAAIEDGRSAVGPTGEEGTPPAALMPAGKAGADDDPAVRILGHHGTILAACARAAHAMARGGEIPREAFGAYVAIGMVDARVEDLRPAADASRGEGGSIDLARFFESGYRSIHPLWPLSMLDNVAVGQVATDLDLRGDNLVLSSSADAGARAFEEACLAIREGACRAAIVGGIAERVCAASIARHALAPSWRTPGEGGAVLVLEDAESARARGVRVLGHVRGAATAFDPGGRDAIWQDAVARAADEALAAAGVARADVARVVSGAAGPLHGTRGSPVSYDDALGDLGAEAGAIGAALALRSMRAGGVAVVLALAAEGGAGAVVLDCAGAPS